MKLSLMNRGLHGPHGSRLTFAAMAMATVSFGSVGRADMVTDWNATLGNAILVANELPPVQERKAAIVQLSVYDAVNGIARKYQPYFVTDKGENAIARSVVPDGAS